jgi:hypothetical protein
LGDAKDTEKPGNGVTRERWTRYVRPFHQLLHRGNTGQLSLIVCCAHQAWGWRDLLVPITERDGLRVVS